MASVTQQNADKHGAGHESSKTYIIGYVLSLVLTVIAFVLALNTGMSHKPLFYVLLVLATLQIFVQLFFFMHVKESDGPSYHVMALILGALFTITIVAGSVWVMTFNSQVL